MSYCVKMAMMLDDCNMSAVMFCHSIRCTPGYQGNLCDQRELANVMLSHA